MATNAGTLQSHDNLQAGSTLSRNVRSRGDDALRDPISSIRTENSEFMVNIPSRLQHSNQWISFLHGSGMTFSDDPPVSERYQVPRLLRDFDVTSKPVDFQNRNQRRISSSRDARKDISRATSSQRAQVNQTILLPDMRCNNTRQGESEVSSTHVPQADQSIINNNMGYTDASWPRLISNSPSRCSVQLDSHRNAPNELSMIVHHDKTTLNQLNGSLSRSWFGENTAVGQSSNMHNQLSDMHASGPIPTLAGFQTEIDNNRQAVVTSNNANSGEHFGPTGSSNVISPGNLTVNPSFQPNSLNLCGSPSTYAAPTSAGQSRNQQLQALFLTRDQGNQSMTHRLHSIGLDLPPINGSNTQLQSAIDFRRSTSFGSYDQPHSTSFIQRPPSHGIYGQPHSTTVNQRPPSHESNVRPQPTIALQRPTPHGSYGQPQSTINIQRPTPHGNYGQPQSTTNIQRPPSHGSYGRPHSTIVIQRPPSHEGNVHPQPTIALQRPTQHGSYSQPHSTIAIQRPPSHESNVHPQPTIALQRLTPHLSNAWSQPAIVRQRPPTHQGNVRPRSPIVCQRPQSQGIHIGPATPIQQQQSPPPSEIIQFSAGPDEFGPKPMGWRCDLCNSYLAFEPQRSDDSSREGLLPDVAVLPCGHVYHERCLKTVHGVKELNHNPTCFRC